MFLKITLISNMVSLDVLLDGDMSISKRLDMQFSQISNGKNTLNDIW